MAFATRMSLFVVAQCAAAAGVEGHGGHSSSGLGCCRPRATAGALLVQPTKGVQSTERRTRVFAHVHKGGAFVAYQVYFSGLD